MTKCRTSACSLEIYEMAVKSIDTQYNLNPFTEKLSFILMLVMMLNSYTKQVELIFSTSDVASINLKYPNRK